MNINFNSIRESFGRAGPGVSGIHSVDAFVKLDHECGNLRGGLVQGGIHAAEIVMILLLVFVAAFAALESKLKTPYPIVLVVAGLF